MSERRTTPDDVAQICLNGDVMVTSINEFAGRPLKAFCDQCGQKAITTCQHAECGYPITGYRSEEFQHPNLPPPPRWKKPLCCTNCGKPYPWMEATIEAANEYADLLVDLTDREREQLKTTFPDLANETPRTQVAIFKFKTLMTKVTPLARAGMEKLCVSLAVDKIKDAIAGVP